jgi:hypothetical protein
MLALVNTFGRVGLGLLVGALAATAACVGSESSSSTGGDASPDGNASNPGQDGGGDATVVSDGGGGGVDGMSSSPDGGTGSDGGSPDGSGTVEGDGGDGGDGGTTTNLGVVLMVDKLNHPFMMTSDSNNVYWTEYGDYGSQNGSVKSCPISGCGAGPLVYAPALLNPGGIAVDATNIYYATSSYSSITGGIWTCPITGCTPSTQKKLAAADSPQGLAVDSQYVYWVDYYNDTVQRVSKTGGTTGTLYDGGGIAVNGPQDCTVDKSFVFLTDNSETLYRVPVGGGDAITMYAGCAGGQEFGLTTDTNFVYFGQPGMILREPKTATDAGSAVVIATGPASPLGLALDPANDTVLYWADYGLTGSDGTLGKVSIDGGGQTNLGSGLASPFAITVSGPYVFWLDNGTPGDAGEDISGTGALYRRGK